VFGSHGPARRTKQTAAEEDVREDGPGIAELRATRLPPHRDRASCNDSPHGLVRAEQDDDFQASAPPRSTRARRSVTMLSQEEQEEQELALAIAASLSDSQSSSDEPGEAAAGAQPASTADGSDTVEILSDSDADTAPNDASEESDFDGASDEDEYEEDAAAEEEEEEEESEGEDEGDWQADEEADNPTGFGKPKPQKSSQKPTGKALAPPKRKAAPTDVPHKKKARGQQKAPLPEATEQTAATACTGNQGGSLQRPPPPAASIKEPVSPVISQLRSPADPAAACPIVGTIHPAGTAAAAAAELEAFEDIGTAALDKPYRPTSLPVQNTSTEAAASSAAKKVASPGPNQKTDGKSVLMPMKQAPRHTGLPSGYKEQAAWTVQGAGLKRSSTGQRLQGGAKIPVGGGRGIKGLGKSRAPPAGLKRGVRGRTGFVAPKPMAQR
jgi:hypothetical protein